MTTESEKIETILEKMVEATNSLCTAYDSVREELDKVAAEEKKNSEFRIQCLALAEQAVTEYDEMDVVFEPDPDVFRDKSKDN